MKITIIATTIMGFEAVLKREIMALGYTSIRVFDTKVEFDAELNDICRVNLWLRTAGRVYIKIAEFKAFTFDELFDQTKQLPWSDFIQKDDQFPVTSVSSRKSTLFSKSDCQSIVKKAMVESLKKAHNTSNLPETNALFPIRIQIENDVVTLSIDSSGTGLNKRGYRAHMDIAPLRETLAAGLVYLSRWRPDRDILLDPLCGTGTLLIEAALIAKNMAPGRHRTFNSQDWELIPSSVWDQAKKEAKDLETPHQSYEIIGSDNNPTAISVAKKNIKLANVDDISLEQLPLKQIQSPNDYGKIITNPPYGERLNDQQQSDRLYKSMGHVFQSQFQHWSYYILTSSETFESHFGKQCIKHRKLYNGGIKCWYYQYFNN